MKNILERLLCPLLLLIMLFFSVLPVWGSEGIRPSALAGAWYPGDAGELAAFVDAALDAADSPSPDGEILALIVPHAGYRYSGATAAAGFALVRGRTFERVILLAPSHRSPLHGLSIADVDAYETPLGRIPLDTEAVARLRESPLVTADPSAHGREHAIEIELPMLQRVLAPDWRLVPILVGRMERPDYRAAADLLRSLVDAETLIVVSSDFTHYGTRFGYSPFPVDEHTPANIRVLDEGAVEQIEALDPAALLDYESRTGISICGYRPLALLLHLLPEQASVHRIAYATSGELTGDFTNSVSYLVLAVTAPAKIAAPQESDVAEDGIRLLHRFAVLGVEQAVLGASEERSREVEQLLRDLPQRLREPAGAFVTLKRDGRLRGCIGYIAPRKPLYQAVLENGINAAVNDPRFRPMEPSELAALEVELSVLSLPEPIASYEDFRVGEQGIILRKDGHQAVFLPQVATEQGWSRDETLNHLARKAGLGANGWRDGASFEVFGSSKYAAPYASANGSD